jgi:acyl-homoserine lactone acylase PvdQ
VLQIWDTAPGARMHRIVQLIEQHGDSHDVATEVAIQADTFSVIAEAIVPTLVQDLGNLGLTGTAATALGALDTWQYTCPTGLASSDPEGAVDPDATAAAEAAGCTVFHVLLYELFAKILADEEELYGVGFFTRMRTHLLIRALTDPGSLATGASFWDDVSTVPIETRDDILAAAVAQTATLLEGKFGGEVDAWRWGRVHTLTFRSIYDSFGLPTYNNGPFANDGGLYTVDVAGFKRFGISMHQTHGATIRVVVEAAPGAMQMKFQHAGGTSLDRESPFYDQFVEPYLKNEPIDFPFGPGAVTSPAITQVFEPLP